MKNTTSEDPRRLDFLALPLLLLLFAVLSGCAQVQANKESDAWDKAQIALKAGIPAEQLLACAGSPLSTVKTGDGERWMYGVSKQMSFASEYCYLTISLRQGRTVGFARRSGNPGGFSDGASVCAYVIDGCLGGPPLASKNEFITGYVTRLTGDDDAAAIEARQSEAAANSMALFQGVAGIQQQIVNGKLQQAAIQQRLIADAQQRAAQAAALKQSNEILNEQNNAAYAARVNAQRAAQAAAQQKGQLTQAGFGAPIPSSPPQRADPPPATAPTNAGSRGPAPDPSWTYSRDNSVSIDYSRNDFDGSYSVYVTNTGNLRLLCGVTVNGQYDPHAGSLHSDSSTNSPFQQFQQSYLGPGSSYQFRFHSPGLNQINSTSQSCTPA